VCVCVDSITKPAYLTTRASNEARMTAANLAAISVKRVHQTNDRDCVVCVCLSVSLSLSLKNLRTRLPLVDFAPLFGSLGDAVEQNRLCPAPVFSLQHCLVADLSM
jgi:hypothetical protein